MYNGFHFHQNIVTEPDAVYLTGPSTQSKLPGIETPFHASNRHQMDIAIDLVSSHRFVLSYPFADFVNLGPARQENRNVISIGGVPG